MSAGRKCVFIEWSPPRTTPVLEPRFAQDVLKAIDRFRRQWPGATVVRIFWDSRSCGHQQDFLSAEVVR